MPIIDVELEKFLEYQLGKRISDKNKSNRKLLSGKFKEKGSSKIFTESFLAYELSRCSASEVHDCYVKYFNRTLRVGEKERISISAEWVKE